MNPVSSHAFYWRYKSFKSPGNWVCNGQFVSTVFHRWLHVSHCVYWGCNVLISTSMSLKWFLSCRVLGLQMSYKYFFPPNSTFFLCLRQTVCHFMSQTHTTGCSHGRTAGILDKIRILVAYYISKYTWLSMWVRLLNRYSDWLRAGRSGIESR